MEIITLYFNMEILNMEKMIDFLYVVYNYFWQYILGFSRNYLNYKNNLLLKNKHFKGLYKNKRCFILGNGPSLRNEDLSLLKEEIVFTVNQIARNEQFDKLQPSFHFWIDNNFFSASKKNENCELIETMIKIMQKESSPYCFYPLNQKMFVEKNGLNNGKERYLDPRLYITKVFKLKIDISNYTYSLGTVVQQAILAAIYMGFNEIYLLGCDSTGIVTTINSALHVDNNTYSYNVTENERHRMEDMVSNSKITDYAYSYYMMLKGFDIIYKNCMKRGVRLFNCSQDSVLDMIPRKSLESVINVKI